MFIYISHFRYKQNVVLSVFKLFIKLHHLKLIYFSGINKVSYLPQHSVFKVDTINCYDLPDWIKRYLIYLNIVAILVMRDKWLTFLHAFF